MRMVNCKINPNSMMHASRRYTLLDGADDLLDVLQHLLKEVLKKLYGPRPEYPNFGAYVAAYFSYGLFGWIEEWFARGMQESAEEITVLLQNRN